MFAPFSTTGMVLEVPKGSNTPGDDLVAWGLATLVADITASDVVLRDDGTRFLVESAASSEAIDARLTTYQVPDALTLPWLAAIAATPENKQKRPPDGVRWVDRDVLRDEYGRWREARRSRAGQPQAGDAPANTISDVRAKHYSLFVPLTSPNPQWLGYNRLAELAQRHLETTEGLRCLLAIYDTVEPLDGAAIDTRLKAIGINKPDDRWRNPPGFLYPGLNKGPTMRLRAISGQMVGQGSAADWQMADRSDRHLPELFLAYLGYFAVAQILDGKQGRIVLVPSPGTVRLRGIQSVLRDIDLGYSTIDDYLLAHSSLSYAQVSLNYVETFQPAGDELLGIVDNPHPELVLKGVHAGIFWQPSGSTYSPLRQTFIPLPAWLDRIYQHEGFTAADATIGDHQLRLSRMRGRFMDEGKLDGERRDAITSYTASLSGQLTDWFRTVRLWFAGARTAERVAGIQLWSVVEVERIAMALDESDNIISIMRDPSFVNIAAAIRRATVAAHFARVNKRRGFDPDYDVLEELAAAADRRPQDFVRRLEKFATEYNNATLRRNKGASTPPEDRRPMIVDEDLVNVCDWVLHDSHRMVAHALVALGSSRGARQPGGEAIQEVDPSESNGEEH